MKLQYIKSLIFTYKATKNKGYLIQAKRLLLELQDTVSNDKTMILSILK